MLVLHYGTNKGRTVIYISNFVGGNAITSNAIGKKRCDEYGASLALVMIKIQQSSHALIVKRVLSRIKRVVYYKHHVQVQYLLD